MIPLSNLTRVLFLSSGADGRGDPQVFQIKCAQTGSNLIRPKKKKGGGPFFSLLFLLSSFFFPFIRLIHSFSSLTFVWPFTRLGVHPNSFNKPTTTETENCCISQILKAQIKIEIKLTSLDSPQKPTEQMPPNSQIFQNPTHEEIVILRGNDSGWHYVARVVDVYPDTRETKVHFFCHRAATNRHLFMMTCCLSANAS